MADNLKKTYDASNFVLTEDYSFRFNQLDVGQPEITASLNPSTQQVQVQVRTWKRAVMEETAGFKYIGMDYATAKSCAAYLRAKFTISVYDWQFGWSEGTGGVYVYGWYKNYATPTLDSEISIEQRNGGCMYDVVVMARCTSLNYTTSADATQSSSHPLLTALATIPGWSSNPTLSGVHFNAASADNITLMVAPTQTTKFELVGQKVITTDPTASTGISVDDWYRATTDQCAQVKYEGMTKAACRSLFSSLNSSSGWWMSYHPWVFEPSYNSTTGKYELGWREDTTTTVYQCLNGFKATEDESGLFTAELTLHAQRIAMTKNPTNYTPPSFPSLWSTKIPGLSNYL